MIENFFTVEAVHTRSIAEACAAFNALRLIAVRAGSLNPFGMTASAIARKKRGVVKKHGLQVALLYRT